MNIGCADLGNPVGHSEDRILSIEFSQHDDERANGGFLFWLWILRRVNRPAATLAPQPNAVIGLHGLYRNDYDSTQIRTMNDGFDFGSATASFTEIDEYWDFYSNELNSFL